MEGMATKIDINSDPPILTESEVVNKSEPKSETVDEPEQELEVVNEPELARFEVSVKSEMTRPSRLRLDGRHDKTEKRVALSFKF